ncbi:hypothetical protein Syun_012965 [Stephania yunnanensis]|uniref:Uncharacterized protein n=1 Tax=Stephania yunnanensis TaxID=152371 RepID=A0AAP0K2P9_9MAGN
MLLAMVEHSRSEALDFFTNRQPNPDGFSPKILKKEQIRKSGRKRDRPKVSISLGPNAQASSNTCHPFSCATFIHIVNSHTRP